MADDSDCPHEKLLVPKVDEDGNEVEKCLVCDLERTWATDMENDTVSEQSVLHDNE